MILLLMINIILSMILCMFINYHIYCGFSASQIRFLAKSDLCNTHVFSPESNGRIPA
ncbi:hypothetical protein H226_4942 [Klebsiella pneumoniae UHKPC18]|nr:hypothetical protein H240_5095 [Klebsiella pneumoniae UHKPC22]EPO63425.1 hypothetical protein H226_4942 [Klebsiella pneumoniae UHKPC18]